MKPWSSRRTVIAGGTALALAALAGGPLRATPILQQQQEHAKEEEQQRPREPNQRAQQQEPRVREPETKERARPEGEPAAPRTEPARVAPKVEAEHGIRPEPQHQAPRPEPARQAPRPAPGPAGQQGARVIAVPPVAIVRTRNGGEIHRGPGGAIREVHTPSGAVIHYAPDGQRRVEVARPDGRVFVASPNGRGGYVQRPYRVGGQPFVQRTYVERGVVTTRVYRPWIRGGVTYNVYLPHQYYRPAYYAWTCRPWGRPVYYPWGWAGRPWYGYYHGWYTPYPYYVSPIFWLTDFMVAVTLEDAYQARLDSDAAGAPPPSPTGGVTPDVRDAIADEVQRQVQEEQAQQVAVSQGYPVPSGPPPLFSDNVSRIFMAYASVPVYAGGQEYFLSEGDVLQLRGAPPANAGYADVTVMASRNPACPRGSVVSVSLQDLQEMQNHMQATIDQGLGTLQSQQGQAGLPPVPAQNIGISNPPYAAAIQPDANAAGELSQVAQEATQSGQSVLSQSPASPASPAGQPGPTRTIALGMGLDEVHSILGSPQQTANLGAKLIEVYPSFKVTYLNGRVTDIQ